MKAFRTAAAWLLGIAVWVLVAHAITLVGHWVDIPSSIDHHPPLLDGNDMEVFSSTTLFGYAGGVFAGLIGAWAGQALFHRSLRAGLTERGTFTLLVWLAGSGMVAVLGGLIHLAFLQEHGSLAFYAQMLFEALSIAGVGFAGRFWWRSQADKRTVRS